MGRIIRKLPDRIPPRPRVLFVGINPGLRSAETGHHFAGPSNRFWRLLHESRLVPVGLAPEDDVRLPEWGYGITNLVAKPTAGLDDLTAVDLRRGARRLEAKIAAVQPRVVALVGVTVYRALFPERKGAVPPGRHAEVIADAPVFVLPNPSGRNAAYSYDEMLSAFTALRRFVSRVAPAPAPPRR
ncbi:MAG: mismatch-specific DNA-glycosylase [Acidimicrobiia bacterium]|nr:mismatch-specific DNA-glycosylase [Acidimicrobiia bacterium]